MKSYLVAMVLSILLSGCAASLEARPTNPSPNAAQPYLPEADWKQSGSSPSVVKSENKQDPLKSSPNTVQPQAIWDSTSIWCSKVGVPCKAAKTKQARSALEAAITFLRQEYGKPVFTGELSLLISIAPNVNGRMNWQVANDRSRLITISEFNLIESEWRILVHEVFHALYQSNEFLTSFPDFVTEGTAVLAEYRYRYRGKGHDFVTATMRDHLKGLGYPGNSNYLDFNIPFAAQGSQSVDALYILAGYYFAIQDPKVLSTLHSILSVKNEKLQGPVWISLNKFTNDYGLVLPDIISSELASKQLYSSTGRQIQKLMISNTSSPIELMALCSMRVSVDQKVVEFFRTVIDPKKFSKWAEKNC